MTASAALAALVLSSLIDSLAAISCMSHPSDTSIECAASVTKCIQTKTGDLIAAGCDGGLCDMYSTIADGQCINIGGSNQLLICGTPGYNTAPTAATFASCPETATCTPTYVTANLYGCGGGPSPTPSPTPAPGTSPTPAPGTGTVQCMNVISGGATTLSTCSSTGVIADGNAGTFCLRRLYNDANGVTQGCDGGFCLEITNRDTCCTDQFGTKSICVTGDVPSAVPTSADFQNCETNCTPAANPGTASYAARSSPGMLAAASVGAFGLASIVAGVHD